MKDNDDNGNTIVVRSSKDVDLAILNQNLPEENILEICSSAIPQQETQDTTTKRNNPPKIFRCLDLFDLIHIGDKWIPRLSSLLIPPNIQKDMTKSDKQHPIKYYLSHKGPNNNNPLPGKSNNSSRIPRYPLPMTPMITTLSKPKTLHKRHASSSTRPRHHSGSQQPNRGEYITIVL